MNSTSFQFGQQSYSLSHVKYHQTGSAGEHGRGKLQRGKNGNDLIVSVPMGTIIKDVDTGEIIADLEKHNDECLVAKGGAGGRGNKYFATSTDRAPTHSSKGKTGEKRVIELELKAIADIGLVGYPNAGKSTLYVHVYCNVHCSLGAVSAAKPKVAAYPFTTLQPTIGRIELEDYSTFTMADIPGLIEGAHVNVGLGHDFLRHIERTKVLVYVLDISGLEGIGMQVMQDNSVKYEFLQDDAPSPDLEKHTPYQTYSETYNINQQLYKDARITSVDHSSTLALDYGEDEDSIPSNKSIAKSTSHVDALVAKSKHKQKSTTQSRLKNALNTSNVHISEIVAPSISTSNSNLPIDDALMFNNLQKLASPTPATRVKRRVYDDVIEYEQQQEMIKAKEEQALQEKQQIKQNKASMYALQPWEVLQKLERELEKYQPGLSKRAKVIVANKVDVPGAAVNLEILKSKTSLPIFPLSAKNNQNLGPFLHFLKKIMLQMREESLSTRNEEASASQEHAK